MAGTSSALPALPMVAVSLYEMTLLEMRETIAATVPEGDEVSRYEGSAQPYSG